MLDRIPLFVVALLLWSTPAVTSPAVRRDDGLNPWVSIDPSGRVSTITPVATSVSGVATTLNVAPASLTATTTASAGDVASTTAPAGTTSTPISGGSAFEVCNNINGAYAPFCVPIQSAYNGTTLYTGKTYYITFASAAFPATSNGTVQLLGTFVNTTSGTFTTQAFQYPTYTGYYPLTADSAWKGQTILLTLTYNGVPKNGPQITIIDEPPVYNQMPATKAPTGQSLYIALPTVFGFILVCLCGGFIINRRHRKIGLGNVMGRKKGYGERKSRRQRMGMGNKNGAIQLREQELTSEGVYKDVPTEQDRGHRRGASEGLEDLVSTPTDERHNVFQEEMRRQDRERGHS